MTQKPIKKAEKARKKPSLRMKWKLMIFLSLFTLFAIALLWLFQTVLLDDMYRLIKTGEVKSCAAALSGNPGDASYEDLVSYTSRKQDVCIAVYRLDGQKAMLTASAHVQTACLLHSAFSVNLLNQLYHGALSEKYYIQQISPYGSAGEIKPAQSTRPSTLGKLPDSIVCAHLTVSEGETYLILLNAEIVPVTATVNTLRILLIFITVVLLLGALGLAMIISRVLTAPVSKMNREAKKLATGDYGVHFSGRGLRETEELSDTLNYAAGELSKVDRMQKELLANISHDLRTPLTMISGYSEVMRDLPGEMTAENMQIIIDETSRLTSLVNDTLDLSRLASGKQVLNLSVFSLTETVRSTLIRYNKLIALDGYTLRFTPGEEVTVYADRTRILQVIYNLINNAVSYTGEDKTVTLTQTVRDGICRISVSDTGVGIPEEQLPLIWERYYKLSEYHRRGAMGSGLGLSIVKNILLLHGSRFGVASEPGHGSTFWFELPCRAVTPLGGNSDKDNLSQ